MKVSISVIVPVYDAERYLEECLESLVNQTLTNIEIIAVNDGSTDGSRNILAKFSVDPRIKVIDLAVNGGSSAARNAAIEVATGEYVGFVDADDYVSLDMFERLLTAARTHSAEVVIGGYEKHDDDGALLSAHPAPIETGVRIDHTRMFRELHRAHEMRLLWFAARNLYKRDLLVRNALAFNEHLRIGVESTFNLAAFYHADGVTAVDDTGYHYRANPESVTSKGANPHLQNSLVEQYRQKRDFYRDFNFDDSAFDDLAKYVVSSQLPRMLWNAKARGHGETVRAFKDILKLEMVVDSLDRSPLIDRSLPRGLLAIIALSKLKQHRLLATYLAAWVGTAERLSRKDSTVDARGRQG